MVSVEIKSGGQILPLALPALALVSWIMISLLRTADLLHHQMTLQISADVTALSACRAQARALNSLALLNQGIDTISKSVDTIIAGWAALVACASACPIAIGCSCLPLLLTYSKKAPPILRKLQSLAQQLAGTQEVIRSATPALVTVVAKTIAADNNSKATQILGATGLLVERQATKKLFKKFLPSSIRLPGKLQLTDDFFTTQKVIVALQRTVNITEERTMSSWASASVQSSNATKSKTLLTASWDAKLIPNISWQRAW